MFRSILTFMKCLSEFLRSDGLIVSSGVLGEPLTDYWWTKRFFAAADEVGRFLTQEIASLSGGPRVSVLLINHGSDCDRMLICCNIGVACGELRPSS